MGVYTSKGSAVRLDASERFAAKDPKLAGIIPAVVEYMTERITEEGKPRVTSTLGVSCEDGVWKVCLTDRGASSDKFDYKIWKSAETLEAALKAIDADLRSGSAEWRKFPKWSPQKRG
jgi:hypothetical protein